MNLSQSHAVSVPRTRKIHALFAMIAMVIGLGFVARDANAASWKLKSTEVAEVSGAWHVFVSIELGSAPAIAHVPMKFLFTKTVSYERDLVDGHADPVMNRMVLSNQMPQILSLDVDFADGSGKIFKGTRFDFGVTRTVGFEAGEYKVQVRTSDGTDIGSAQNIILKGDNPVVDRRSIAFNAKDSKVKKVDNGLDGGSNQVASNNVESAVPTNGDVAPVGTPPPFIGADAYKTTPEEQGLQEHPKGCGCSIPGGVSSRWGWASFPLLAALVFFRRKRARSQKS